MNIILIFISIILAGVIGFVIGRKTSKTFGAKSENEMDDMREEAREALIERTEKRKGKILEMLRKSKDDFTAGCNLREGENKKGITRNDIEELLNVSDTTTGKYLNELEDERKIKQVGTSGKDVYYVIVK